LALSAELAALDFCYVTTTGRTTGVAPIEIWFAAAPMPTRSSCCRRARARRLGAQPRRVAALHGRDRRQRFVGYGRVIEGTADDELARTLVHDKYAHGDDLASWRESALPIAIDFTPAADQP
jgi:hypothetical protein